MRKKNINSNESVNLIEQIVKSNPAVVKIDNKNTVEKGYDVNQRVTDNEDEKSFIIRTSPFVKDEIFDSYNPEEVEQITLKRVVKKKKGK